MRQGLVIRHEGCGRVLREHESRIKPSIAHQECGKPAQLRIHNDPLHC